MSSSEVAVVVPDGKGYRKALRGKSTGRQRHLRLTGGRKYSLLPRTRPFSLPWSGLLCPFFPCTLTLPALLSITPSPT